MILIRTGSISQFDLWLKIPSVQRFNKEYLHQQGVKSLNQLSDKLGGIHISVVIYPQEYYYTYAQMGPSRYLTFSKEEITHSHPCSFKNVHLHSPENWSNFGWDSQFNRLDLIYNNLMKWWKFKQENSRKKEREEAHL